MPRFAYSALSPAGDLVTGSADGPDSAAIIARLHDQGLLPIDAISQQAATAVSSRWRLAGTRALPRRDLAMFSQQLARLLRARLPLDRALEILTKLAERRQVQRVLHDTLERVRNGSTLAGAMEAQGKAFPSVFVNMIRAGEGGGALESVLSRAADFLTRGEAMRQKVVSALIYPAILVVVAVLSVGLVLTVVLPQFAPLFAGASASLPSSTRVVLAASDLLRGYWWTLPLGGLIGALGWQRLMRHPTAAWQRDRCALMIPILRDLITRFEVGRFARTFGALRTNGVPAPAALALCGRMVGNRVIAGAIEDVTTRFREGEGLSAPLARTGRFPELATQLIRIGEETGRLEEMLGEVAEIYDQDVQRTLERLLAILIPGLTILMGIIIAFIIAAVMTAMISINELAV